MNALEICARLLTARYECMYKTINYINEYFNPELLYQTIEIKDKYLIFHHMCDIDLIEDSLTQDVKFIDYFIKISLLRDIIDDIFIIEIVIMKKYMFLVKD